MGLQCVDSHTRVHTFLLYKSVNWRQWVRPFDCFWACLQASVFSLVVFVALYINTSSLIITSMTHVIRPPKDTPHAQQNSFPWRLASTLRALAFACYKEQIQRLHPTFLLLLPSATRAFPCALNYFFSLTIASPPMHLFLVLFCSALDTSLTHHVRKLNYYLLPWRLLVTHAPLGRGRGRRITRCVADPLPFRVSRLVLLRGYTRAVPA